MLDGLDRLDDEVGPGRSLRRGRRGRARPLERRLSVVGPNSVAGSGPGGPATARSPPCSVYLRDALRGNRCRHRRGGARATPIRRERHLGVHARPDPLQHAQPDPCCLTTCWPTPGGCSRPRPDPRPRSRSGQPVGSARSQAPRWDSIRRRSRADLGLDSQFANRSTGRSSRNLRWRVRLHAGQGRSRTVAADRGS